MTDDVITLNVTCEDILWQMLPCCGLLSSTYKIVKVIKPFRKLASKDSGIIFMIIIIYFYNDDDDDDDYYYYCYK